MLIMRRFLSLEARVEPNGSTFPGFPIYSENLDHFPLEAILLANGLELMLLFPGARGIIGVYLDQNSIRKIPSADGYISSRIFPR